MASLEVYECRPPKGLPLCRLFSALDIVLDLPPRAPPIGAPMWAIATGLRRALVLAEERNVRP